MGRYGTRAAAQWHQVNESAAIFYISYAIFDMKYRISLADNPANLMP
jgi:hypothetical protein